MHKAFGAYEAPKQFVETQHQTFVPLPRALYLVSVLKLVLNIKSLNFIAQNKYKANYFNEK